MFLSQPGMEEEWPHPGGRVREENYWIQGHWAQPPRSCGQGPPADRSQQHAQTFSGLGALLSHQNFACLPSPPILLNNLCATNARDSGGGKLLSERGRNVNHHFQGEGEKGKTPNRQGPYGIILKSATHQHSRAHIIRSTTAFQFCCVQKHRTFALDIRQLSAEVLLVPTGLELSDLWLGEGATISVPRWCSYFSVFDCEEPFRYSHRASSSYPSFQDWGAHFKTVLEVKNLT